MRACTMRFTTGCIAMLLLAGVLHPQSVTPPRSEYPRPDRERDTWQSLNGAWDFAFDDADQGLAQSWYRSGLPHARQITVPFAFETKDSGIGDTTMHDVVWYRRTVGIPDGWKGKRVLLNFGAVNYAATVWVNGEECGTHEGGQSGFSFDITDLLRKQHNDITVRVFFPSRDNTIPRGKQYWEPVLRTIWYDRTEGIWQPVWLEPVNASHLESLKVIPDVDASQVHVNVLATGTESATKLRITALFNGAVVAKSETSLTQGAAQTTLSLKDQKLWSPENPALYDLTLELLGSHGEVLDHVRSYFGQRKVGLAKGRFELNGKPYFLRLVLDQGYWPESLLTPPSDAAMRSDIETIKAMGFNGARLHQKVEDPRFLYWADKLGLAVWGEMANAQNYTDQYARRMTREWTDVVLQDENHPSIVTWVPLNESWGVRGMPASRAMQAHAISLYFLTRSLDTTRPVIDNDGWEHTGFTDLFTLHDYAATGTALKARYAGLGQTPPKLPAIDHKFLLDGFAYGGQPILLTEFGGVAFRPASSTQKSDFGYAGAATSQAAFLSRVGGLVDGILATPEFAGYCYTQFSDVEQEVNGLVTYDRVPKAPTADLHAIFSKDPSAKDTR